MKKAACILSILVIGLACGLTLTGCDGDSDSSTPESTATPTITESGTAIAAAGVATNVKEVTIPSAGTLIAIIEWSAPPNNLVSFFKRSGEPTNYGWVESTSPLTISTSIAADKTGDFTLYVSNSSASDVAISWIITFTPSE